MNWPFLFRGIDVIKSATSLAAFMYEVDFKKITKNGRAKFCETGELHNLIIKSWQTCINLFKLRIHVGRASAHALSVTYNGGGYFSFRDRIQEGFGIARE